MRVGAGLTRMRLIFSGNRPLRRKDQQQQKLAFSHLHQTVCEKSPKFKGSVINTGSFFSGPGDKKAM